MSSSSPPEPIAIVGMGMRLPGGVKNEQDFWDLMVNKRDGRCEVPADRYNINGFYHPTKPGSVRTQYGHFLQEDPGKFDRAFFSIGDAEASSMDPQQRLLLEVVWECMENAGQVGWRGTPIGCYVGVFGEDWLDISSKDPQAVDWLHCMGTGDFVIANRVSYEFDLQGPSMTFRTGCSSSLVALHHACQALLSGDCDSAIVAGTNMLLGPTMTTTMSDNMVLSPSGICKTFDAGADGYSRGEAINALYIKRLADAVRDGDCVRAVIRATATNCDGRTPSISTPGSKTQETLIRSAYARACIEDIGRTGFFECHGTGTVMGDTAETSVVGKIFTPEGVLIGSVKPNVGHSEGASGLTSVIKSVLALEHRTIPPNIHFSTPSPNLRLDEQNLVVPTECVSWPSDRLERVSVNCFGVGGSNGHVILDSADSMVPNAKTPPQPTQQSPKLAVVSAMSRESLERQIDAIVEFVNSSGPNMADLAYTLGERREKLNHKAFCILDTTHPITPEMFHKSECKVSEVSFIFTGQGAQWAGMGREMSDDLLPTIRHLDRVIGELEDAPGWSIENELRSGAHVDDPEFSQPLCTALQIAFVNLLQSWNIQPISVVGHSSGEIAAAYAAGAISAETAIILAYYRGKVVKELTRPGGMAALGLSESIVREYLQKGVEIACINSPESVTLSGDVDSLQNVIDAILEELPDTFHRILPVNVAYHSSHMEEAAARYEERISAHIQVQQNMTPMYSTVDSKAIITPSQLDAVYWSRNLRHPVLFSPALESLLKETDQGGLLVEIGPHSALSSAVRQILEVGSGSKNFEYIPTLVRGGQVRQCLLATAGQLHLRSIPVNFGAINGPGRLLKNLPSYPWQRDGRFWSETRLAKSWRLREHPHHELLGSLSLEASTLEPAWRNLLRPERVSWIWQHKLQNRVIFPCAGFVAMIGEAIRQHTFDETYSIENLILKTPLILDDVATIELLTTLHPERLSNSTNSGWYVFCISSYHDGAWVKHCSGKAMPGGNSSKEKIIENAPLLRQVSSELLYQAFKKGGLDYGPQFQGLRDITACPARHRSMATISDDQALHESRYSIHPTVIDHALQAIVVAFCQGLPYTQETYGIPASIGRLYVGKGGVDMRVTATCQVQGATYQGEVLASVGNTVAISMHNILLFTIESDGDDHAGMIPPASTLEWKPAPDMLPPSLLLESSAPSDPELSLQLEALINLYIIETAARLRSVPASLPHLNKYKSWLIDRLPVIRETANRKFPGAEKWLGLDSCARNMLIDVIYDAILSEDPDGAPIAKLVRSIFENCVDIMTGEKSALDVLMQDDHLEGLYKVHAKCARWSRFFSLLGHSNPTLRVLEIGAGTGGTTSKVLDLLKSSSSGTRLYSTYEFTDITSGFLLAAKEKFQGIPGIEYRTLDISQSPIDQGFQPGKYDLIIASNVLHATDNIAAALTNVRQLLSEDGYLFLQELCPETKSINYIMGVLPGWWMGESDGRPDEPYIRPSEWEKRLVDAGFTGIEAINYDHEPPYQLSATILSRRTRPPTSPAGTIHLLHDGKPSQTAYGIANHLQKQGYLVQWRDVDDCLSSPSIGANTLLSVLDLEKPYLATMSADEYERLHRFLNHSKDMRILWITRPVQFGCRDPRFGLILGLARTIRFEIGMDFATVEIADSGASWQLGSLQCLVSILRKFEKRVEIDSDSPEYEYIIHNERVFVGRFDWTPMSMVPSGSPPATSPDVSQALNIRHYGVLDTIEWRPVTVPPLGDGEVEVEIHYVGLNFRDIMVTLGVMGNKEELGLEAVGTVCRVSKDVKKLQVGSKVFVIAPGSFCQRKVTGERNCASLPDGMSVEEAATMMPSVFLTAIYSLIDIGQVEEGQSVLIHSAAGGVGIAAIQICQLKKAIIYATVGSPEKAQFLTDEYGIPSHQIFHSRDASFVEDIMQKTNGRGVDIVLNSLSGELLQASWKCVAKFGKMLELGKRDILGQGALNMENFSANRSFIGVDVLQLGQDCPEKMEKLFDKLKMFHKSGDIYPLRPVTMVDAADVIQGFRYMQSGTHKGKIVVNMNGDKPLKGSQTVPPLSFSSQKAYLLVGGLGGIGRVVANWMVSRGAEHLAFFSRSAGQSSSDQAFFEELRAQGCQVTAIAGNAAHMDDVQRVLSVISMPLGGIIQLSMVLQDQAFPKMSYDEWGEPMVSKVHGTWMLHRALENTSLDFFVVFSSIVGLGGNIGQANYAAANTYLDAFVSYRQSRGLPASVLNLGIMDRVGITERDPTLLDRVRAGAMYLVSIQELLQGLEITIRRSQTDSSPTATTEWSLGTSHLLPIGFSSTKQLSDPGVRPLWSRDARFQLYTNAEVGTNHISESSSSTIRQLLAQIEANPQLLDDPETDRAVEDELVNLICSHMPAAEGRAPENIAIDSLMTIEIRNWVRRNLALELSVVDISNSGTIAGLVKLTSKVLREKFRPAKEGE